MKLDLQEPGAEKQVTILPCEENGIFVVEGDAEVGWLHANRAVGRIVIYGLDNETIQSLETGELEITELFQQDATTQSITLDIGRTGLAAQVESDGTATGGAWKSINAFREFRPADTPH